MPYHEWGDEDFDWKSLYQAEDTIRKIVKLGRVGIHSKEKYGTLRYSFFLFDGSLHSLTHPSYVYSRYPDWLWKLDVRYKPLKLLKPIVTFFQVKIIQFAFTVVTNRYPHIKNEILSDSPKEILPPDLAMRAAKLWHSSCQKCGEMSTTDNYICPYCKKEKRG